MAWARSANLAIAYRRLGLAHLSYSTMAVVAAAIVRVDATHFVVASFHLFHRRL